MTFKLSDFKEGIGTLARPNLFEAKLSGYQNIIGLVTESLEDISSTFTFRCETAEVPGRAITTSDDAGASPNLKLADDIAYRDITLTIICSEDMRERHFFELWMDKIVGNAQRNQSKAGLLGYYDEYARGCQLEVSCFSQVRNIKTWTVNMIDAWPIDLGIMSASWEDNNTYQRFQVVMNYRRYTYRRPQSSVEIEFN